MEDLFESVKPPSMANDLETGFEPTTNVKKTPVVGGGLLGTLKTIISKGTRALRIRSRSRKQRKRMTRKAPKRNKLGRFSRRR